MHYSSPTRILVWNAAHSQLEWHPSSSNPVSLRSQNDPLGLISTETLDEGNTYCALFFIEISRSPLELTLSSTPTTNNILTLQQSHFKNLLFDWNTITQFRTNGGSSESDTIRLRYIERITIQYFLYTSTYKSHCILNKICVSCHSSKISEMNCRVSIVIQSRFHDSLFSLSRTLALSEVSASRTARRPGSPPTLDRLWRAKMTK